MVSGSLGLRGRLHRRRERWPDSSGSSGRAHSTDPTSAASRADNADSPGDAGAIIVLVPTELRSAASRRGPRVAVPIPRAHSGCGGATTRTRCASRSRAVWCTGEMIGHACHYWPLRRRRPESNRCKRLCRPLRNHSATSPGQGILGAARRAARRSGPLVRLSPSYAASASATSGAAGTATRRRRAAVSNAATMPVADSPTATHTACVNPSTNTCGER